MRIQQHQNVHDAFLVFLQDQFQIPAGCSCSRQREIDTDKGSVGLVQIGANALRDPLSGNLDRIQIVKVWVDAAGERQEKVFDAVWSGDRKPGTDGTLPKVGNTVDVANATWTNTIGSPELIAVWTDPEFDPGLGAAYYARVLEIPTPRWTAYEAKRFGITMKEEIPMVTVERAYTSPIWYTPGN